jgi:putative thioredoxin
VWLTREVVGAPDTSELDARVEANSNDHEARYLRALTAAERGDWDAAMGDLLQVIVRDREWRDDGARKAMVNLFRILGEDSPLTSKWRVEMGRAMYV